MGRPSKAEQQARRTAEAARMGHAQRRVREGTSAEHPPMSRDLSAGRSAVTSHRHLDEFPGSTPQAVSRNPSTSPLYDPLLSVDEVSQWLGKPKNTLYAWRARGLGPRTIKVGNSLRYRRSDVEAYLDANTDPVSRA